jgi:hypothetical protein
MRVQYLGGPTAILRSGGVRMLTDPTFDPPGERTAQRCDTDGRRGVHCSATWMPTHRCPPLLS